MSGDPLWRALRLLGTTRRRVALAVLAGSAGLASAVGLAAVSAWLIARASQQPPVMYLMVAVVAVRTLGISRGVLRYLDRLASHDLALRGMATLRERLYARLAAGDTSALVRLRRGDLLARVGADVDAVGDAVVRGLLPAAVAAVVSVGSVGLVAAFLPAAGAVLALCLVLVGVVSPAWAARGARTASTRGVQARAAVSAASLALLEGAAELRVRGLVGEAVAQLRSAEQQLAAAADDGARPAAVAAGLGPLGVGLAVLGALALGIPAATAGVLDPVELAVVVLTPLAAFEAALLLPGAAVTLLRSRAAATRVMALLDAAGPEPAADQPADHPDHPDHHPRATTLVARGLAVGWPGGPPLVTGIDLTLEPGARVAVVGPSGVGKTTLLLTLAGLLPPLAGQVRLGGRDVHLLARAEAARAVTMTAEDAHVFDTTVLENLRVSRGDVTAVEALSTLETVGLGTWVAGLPDGLETMLGSDATAVSGGQRRRLLLARALLSPAPLLLLDEPTEHLDTEGPALLAALLDATLAPGRGVVVVTHADVAGHPEVIRLHRDR